MKTIKLSTASRTLAEYAAEFADEIVVLTERNKAVAAIVPLKGVDRESLALSAHPGFLDIIARSRAQFARGEVTSLSDMKAAFPSRPSPNKRLQPAKAHRHPGKRRAATRRLRG